MGRPKSPYGYKNSRHNSLTHGVDRHDLLPSRGPDKCYHAEQCPIAETTNKRHLCVAGDACTFEELMHERYLASARTYWAFCKGWVSDQRFEELIHELSICTLRRMRLQLLVNREGIMREKCHPVSGTFIGWKESLGTGRYPDAISHRFNRAYAELLNRPELAGEDVARRLGM